MAIQTLDNYLKKKKNNTMSENIQPQQTKILTLEDYASKNNFSLSESNNQFNDTSLNIPLEKFGSINSDGYADLGKTWGDYYYHDYAKNGKYKLYAKNDDDGKIGFYYYDENDKKYKTFGNQSWLTSEESDKKALEEAKSLGYVGDDKEIDTLKKLLSLNEPEEKQAPILDLVKKSDLFDDGYQKGDVIKTIGSTVGDLATDIGKGFLNTTEGITDAAEYKLADFLNYFGFNKAADSIKEHAKTNATGAIFGTNETDNLFRKGWSEELEKNSVLGSLADSVGQGIGNVGAMAGLGYLTGGKSAATFANSFASAYGSARSEAYENGADDKDARTYATINGFAEALSEQFFDAIPGTKTAGWGEKLVGKVAGGVQKYFGSPTGKIVSKILSNTGEGFEEIISSMLSTTANDIMYKINSDYNYNKDNVTGDILQDLENAAKTEWLPSFLSASLTSALVNVGNTFVSEQQKNQILKSYAKENNMSVEDVKTMFEKNVSDQVKTEENLPYMERQKQQENIEYKTLQQMKEGTLIDQDRETKISNMLESANKFNFKDSKETTSMLDTISKVIKDKNYNVLFDNTIVNSEGNPVNAQIKTLDNGETEIRLNPNSERAAEFLLCHEIMHSIETDNVKKLIIDYASKNIEFNDALESLKQTYGTEDVSSEVIADISGQLLGHQEFINNLSMKEPNIFRKIYNKIISLANRITGNSKESLFIKDLKNKWEQAYRTQNNNIDKAKFAIANTDTAILTDNQKYRISKANEYLEKGYNADEVWKSTGVNKINENRADFYVRDLKFKKGVELEPETVHTLKNVMEGELFDNYPNFKDVKFYYKDLVQEAKKKGITNQEYLNKINSISGATLNDGDLFINSSRIKTLDGIESILSHEIQHKIQELQENGSEETGYFGIDNNNNFYYKGVNEQEAEYAYRNNPLEIEAEISRVLNRMTNEQRHDIPLSFIKQEVSKYYSITSKSINLDKFISNLEKLYYNSDRGSGQNDTLLGNNTNSKRINSNLERNENRFTFDNTNNRLLEKRRGDKSIKNLFTQEFESDNTTNNETNRNNQTINQELDDSSFSFEENETNDKWQEFLEKNFKSTGTKTYFNDLNLPSESINLPVAETTINNNSESKNIDNSENIKAAESIIGDKNTYLSKEADKLYDEIYNLRKGVKASKELARVLDLGHDGTLLRTKEEKNKYWENIKTALANIKWKPEQVVNKDSKVENRIRTLLENDYAEKIEDLSYSELGIKDKTKMTPEDTVKIKRANYIKEVYNLTQSLETISSEIDDKIKNKQKEYELKKNKDTKVAQNILRQISDLTTRKENIEADYNRRIQNLSDKVKNFDVKFESRKIKRAQYKENLRNEIDPLIDEASKWKDKKFLGGFRYGRETAQRNMIDIAGKEKGNAINQVIFDPITEHEANKTRRIQEKFDVIKDLDLDLKKKYDYAESVSPDGKVKKVKIGEDELVRLYIEKKISDFDLEDIGADVTKIKKASSTISNLLEGIFNDVNEVFNKMGIAPVEYRKNYFPHGLDEKSDSLLTKLVSKVGIDISNQELPTTIAGKTDTFKPNKAWNGHLLQRTKDNTNFDAIGNLEKYIVGIEDIIAHTEDIQKVRTLSQEIRDQFTDEYIKEKVESIRNNENILEEDKDRIIDDIYKRENSQLSGLITWLDEYANILANKKSFADRDMERTIGRNAYTSMSNIEGIIASNTIGANASVSLTNFAPIAQALATTKGRYLVKASMEVLANDIKSLTGNKDTSFVESSDFLVNRFGTDNISRQKFSDKIKNIAFKPMEIVDNFTSEVIVRAKYYENLSKGMSEDAALAKADKDAGKIMADRSKGALPTIFNKKNPFNKLITMFQVEPNNIISNYTKDMSTDASSKGQLAYQYTKLAIGSYVFNSILMGIRGGNEVLPDPIRFVQYLIEALTGDDEERDKAKGDMLEAITGSLPFVSNIAGLFGIEDVGRIPISSGVPNLTNLPSLFDDEISDEYKSQTIRDEIIKPLSYLLFPTGAAQTWKTIQGLEAVNNGGSYKYAKDGSQTMQFPVDDPTAADYIKSSLFGKYSLDNAKEYVDSGFKSLKEKDANTYKELNLPYKKFLEYKDGISNAKKIAKENGESQTQAAYEYIYNLPIFDNQKNIMINSTLNKSDEVKDKNGYIKYVDNKNRSYWYDKENDVLYNRNYHEISTSKLKDLTQYSNMVDMSDYGSYETLEEFNYANKNPEKYSAIMQITDYSTFRDYQDDIEDINDKYSDMMDKALNSKQKSMISAKKKQEVQKYINSLSLNKYQKIMLEKLAGGYSIKNYKNMMQKYINGLDISKSEKESIDAALFK